MTVFISHSSKDNAAAAELEKRLEQNGLAAWTDLSDMQAGPLVDEELLARIRAANLLLLLWSEPARDSNWVAAEWLVAFHEDKLVVPCVLDNTELPQCLQKTAFVDMHWDWDRIVAQLLRTAEVAPQQRTRVVVPARVSRPPAARAAIGEVCAGQWEVLQALDEPDIGHARRLQQALDPKVEDMLRRWPYDTLAITVEGYHHKNTYQVQHRDAIRAGVRPGDPILDRAERCFFQALSIDPTDHAALNGMGNYRWFLNELEAARFFTLKAIEWGEKEGADTAAYRHDLGLIERDVAAQAARA